MNTLSDTANVSKKEDFSSLKDTNKDLEMNSKSGLENEKYNAILLDTNAFIKSGGNTSVIHKYQQNCNTLYTVSGVLKEIMDSKSRENFSNQLLLNDIQVREPSKKAVEVVKHFAKCTGDYNFLSLVDIQLIALLYDLELEGCKADMNHVRLEPKHIIGKGKLQFLQNEKVAKVSPAVVVQTTKKDSSSQEDNKPTIQEEKLSKDKPSKPLGNPSSWAQIVNYSKACTINSATEEIQPPKISLPKTEEDLGGQFSDAEEENDYDSHEESALEKEIQSDFPSLSAAIQYISISPSAEENKKETINPIAPTSARHYNSFSKYGDIVKSKGLIENVKETPEKEVNPVFEETVVTPQEGQTQHPNNDEIHQSRIIGGNTISGQMAIIHSDEDDDSDVGEWVTIDTLASVKKKGNVDSLFGGKNNSKQLEKDKNQSDKLPHKSKRSALITTDYAMQNIILQMNLVLLSVEGSKPIKQLKYWVQRCQACFYILPPNGSGCNSEELPRLFCPKCGNANTLQRISAKVDSKTGRVILFRTKNQKILRGQVRGVKYSLPSPKPLTGMNRYTGDILLREDQLLQGAWKHKIKKHVSENKKYFEENCAFGSDVIAQVGLDDIDRKMFFIESGGARSANKIQAGFGRRNPNSSKFGRERRGKKKKGGEKSCGLRRY